MCVAPMYVVYFRLNLRRRKNDPSSELVPSTKGTRLKFPDLMMSLGCAVRKGSGLPAVLTSLTGLQNMSYCVTQRLSVVDSRYICSEVIASVKIHFVAFRLMVLCIVIYCYAASVLRKYSLPKCWYPPVKLCRTDTI